MGLERQAVHRGNPAPRDPVHPAGLDAGCHDPPLIFRRVKERLSCEHREMGDHPIGPPVGDPGHHEVIDPHHGGDLPGQRPLPEEAGAHVPHPNLVSAVTDADRGQPAWRLQEERVERRVPGSDGLAARVPVAAVRRAPGALHRHQVRGPDVADPMACASRRLGMGQGDQFHGLAKGLERRLHEGRGDVVGHITHRFSEEPQGATEDRRARGPVGLRHPRPHGEPRCQDHQLATCQRARGGSGASRPVKPGDAPRGEVEGEQLIDRICSSHHLAAGSGWGGEKTMERVSSPLWSKYTSRPP